MLGEIEELALTFGIVVPGGFQTFRHPVTQIREKVLSKILNKV